MDENIEFLLRDIKKIVFKSKDISRERKKRHDFVQQKLFGYFIKKGFSVKSEFGIIFRKLSRRKGSSIKSDFRNGYIDIYAEKKGFRIAIEFDSGQSVKWKSLEKLFQSKAQLCIALVSGPTRNLEISRKICYERNLKRAKQVTNEIIDHFERKDSFSFSSTLKDKRFWIGIVNLGIFEKINLYEFYNH